MPQSRLSRRVLHRRFLSILPLILRHAKVYFRYIKCWHTKEDRIAEVRALCWKWFRRLAEQGKDACQFPTVLADYAARAVKCGRRVCGQLKAKDVMSERAQQMHGFTVRRLPSSAGASLDNLYARPRGQQLQDEWEQRLQDNTVTPVDEAVAFKLDFRAWLRTLTPRQRRLIRAMLRNERTRDLSQAFQVSEGRVSQMRRQFHDGWKGFVGEGPVCHRRPLRRRKRARAACPAS